MNTTAGIVLIILYLLSIAGVYTQLRSRGVGISASVALAIPLCQSFLSLGFQIGFLLGIVSLAALLGCAVCISNAYFTFKDRRMIVSDSKELWGFFRRYPFTGSVCLLVLLYSLAQVLLIPPRNADALTYHFSRVFLFIQEETFFLDSFSRYHEAVFPVGADILFYPFIAISSMAGMGIISLSSYISIGAAAYAVARSLTKTENAVLSAFIVIALKCIVLQSVSVKNDIVMAGALGACLVILLGKGLDQQLLSRRIWLLVWISAFGMSCKTTFIALIPGLGLLAIIHWKLFRIETIRPLIVGLRSQIRPAFIALVGVIILSQVWLYVRNASVHETWSGPDSFTEMHKNKDGIEGGIANASRYAIQTLEVGFLSDQFPELAYGIEGFSTRLQAIYNEKLQPIFDNKGLSNWPFLIRWTTYEDHSWFGLGGALMLFICVPVAIITAPRKIYLLLPAILYFAIISYKVSWMPWNGRFFSAFFVCLIPALAITTNLLTTTLIKRALLALVAVSLLNVKAIDFSRPLLPFFEELVENRSNSFSEFVRNTVVEQPNVWSETWRSYDYHPGEPSTLLDSVEQGASVAIYLVDHRMHFGYYLSRPDIHWEPTHYLVGHGQLDLTTALAHIADSAVDYILIVGATMGSEKEHQVASSENGIAHLLRVDKAAMLKDLPLLAAIQAAPEFNDPVLVEWRNRIGVDSP